MFWLGILMLSCVAGSAQASDPRIIGSWRTTTYTIQGVDHPMDGIMIFTPGYFAANVILNFTGGDVDDANANSGPYWAEDGKIIFVQWMQLHLRPGDPEETFLIELSATTGIIVDPSAATPFSSRNNSEHQVLASRKGDRLTFTFGSGTVQVFDRIELAGPTDIYWLEGGALGLIDQHFILAVDSGAKQLSGSGTFTRKGKDLTLDAERWFEVDYGKPSYRSGSRISASIVTDGVIVQGKKIALRR